MISAALVIVLVYVLTPAWLFVVTLLLWGARRRIRDLETGRFYRELTRARAREGWSS